MRQVMIASAVVLAAPVAAQSSADRQHTINVSGHGKVSVAPDMARIHYWIRGEGTTPDDATRAMSNSQKQVEQGLKGFLGAEATITNSDLLVIQVHDPKCSDQQQPRLSEGACAVIGYLARIEGDLSTSSTDKAGTAVGLASRLGASDARIQGFELRDVAKARADAMSKAVADSREQAQILAIAAGGHLGRVLNIQYGAYTSPLTLTGSRVQYLPAVPAPPPPPPVQIGLRPQPQEVSADVSVSYELLP